MLSTLILYIEVPEMTLLTRINNNAHADMHSTPYQRENIHIRGHLLQSCFGLAKFSGFQCTKTSVNKRLYIMSCDVPYWVCGQDNPARFPQREASRRQKYSTKRRYARERVIFLPRRRV